MKASKLALGTAQFGTAYGIANHNGQVPPVEAKRMLALASSQGITTIDTASAYGGSEACLGDIGVANFRVVTKLPSAPQDCANVEAWVHNQVANSLSSLHTGRVYGLLVHDSRQLLGSSGNVLFGALNELKADGLVEKIGVSIYDPNELDTLYPQFQFDLIQAPFNLLDRRLSESGWLRRLKDGGVEVHARSAFLQGLLLMPQEAMPSKFARWSGMWTAWQRWQKESGISPLRTCLAVPLSYPEIDQVVVGADSYDHLSQIIEATYDAPLGEFPDLQCNDTDLINPSRWSSL